MSQLDRAGLLVQLPRRKAMEVSAHELAATTMPGAQTVIEPRVASHG
jgi:hypothetical protein